VYTPPALASAMVETIMDSAASWLDPCVGTGAFLSALANAGVSSRRVRAVDLDPADSPADSLADVTRGVDFLAWATRADMTFDRIIANPPYMPIRRLPAALQSTALRVHLNNHLSIPQGANYWCAFLCQSLTLLADRGAICFVLPAAWEYADYAHQIREVVPGTFEDFDVHRSARPLFPGVQDGSVVVVGRGFKRASRRIRYFQHSDSGELEASLRGAATAGSSNVVNLAR
jgi:adenine-specific DNA-methyltransferase